MGRSRASACILYGMTYGGLHFVQYHTSLQYKDKIMSEDLKLNPLQRDLLRALAFEQTFIAVRAGWGSGKTSALVFAISAD